MTILCNKPIGIVLWKVAAHKELKSISNICLSKAHIFALLRGDYMLLLSNFVLDITFKQIH